VLFSSKAFEQEHPELVEQVVGAIIEGWYDAFEHVEDAIDVTMQYQRSDNPDDRVHQKNMLLKMKEFMLVEQYGNKIGWCDAERWQRTLEAFLNDHPEADFTLDEMLTNEYVEAFYAGKRP
jgi:ABC-type nitrate/sulfonate/bicarbonate transport system substrate-binding protein